MRPLEILRGRWKEDQNLAAYLEALMDKAYSIDYDLYKSKPVGKVEIMLETCDKTNDMYSGLTKSVTITVK